MIAEQFNNKLLEREKILGELKNCNAEKIQQLIKDIRNEHQKMIFAEAQSNDDKQREVLHRLSLENERQLTVVNQYLSVQYKKSAQRAEPNKPIIGNAFRAFLVGGLICVLGQLVINYFVAKQGLDFKTASGLASVSIVIITAVLTGFGLYDEIGRFGGAGSNVPISGFANSITSAALEFKREGMIYGVGAKIFTIAGPVILYGVIASIIVGLIAFLMM